jgi:hypothetical protein
LRLKGRLLFQPGVMVTSVPWQLHSSRGRAESVAEAAALAQTGTDPLRLHPPEPPVPSGATDGQPSDEVTSAPTGELLADRD